MSETSPAQTPEMKAFVQWLNDGPKLAKAAGVYVGIKVSAFPAQGHPHKERKSA